MMDLCRRVHVSYLKSPARGDEPLLGLKLAYKSQKYFQKFISK